MSAKDIIIAAAGGGQTTTSIEYVGGKTVTITPSSASNTTISLTDLTGSPDPTLLPGDIVIVSYAIGSPSQTVPTIISNAYTEIATLWVSDSYDANLYSAYKLMGATPDTSVVVGPTTNLEFGACVAIQAYRYVDEIFPLQAPANTATFANTVRPTPPTITPWDNDSVAVIVGAGAHLRGNVAYTTTGLTSFISTGSTDQNSDASIGAGFRVIQSGSYSPNQFSFPQPDATTYSSVALSVALKPKPDTVIPSFISYRAVAVTSGTTATITKPTNTQENDFLLLTVSCDGGSITATPPSGFTLVTSIQISGNGSYLVYKKIATGSEPASYSVTVSAGDFSCVISVFRDATTINTVGNISQSSGSETATSITPTFNGLNLILFGNDAGATATATPTGVTEFVKFEGSGAACSNWVYGRPAGAFFATGNVTLGVGGGYTSTVQLQLTDE